MPTQIFPRRKYLDIDCMMILHSYDQSVCSRYLHVEILVLFLVTSSTAVGGKTPLQVLGAVTTKARTEGATKRVIAAAVEAVAAAAISVLLAINSTATSRNVERTWVLVDTSTSPEPRLGYRRAGIGCGSRYVRPPADGKCPHGTFRTSGPPLSRVQASNSSEWIVRYRS